MSVLLFLVIVVCLASVHISELELEYCCRFPVLYAYPPAELEYCCGSPVLYMHIRRLEPYYCCFCSATEFRAAAARHARPGAEVYLNSTIRQYVYLR